MWCDEAPMFVVLLLNTVAKIPRYYYYFLMKRQLGGGFWAIFKLGFTLTMQQRDRIVLKIISN